jgi:hypothetical protein
MRTIRGVGFGGGYKYEARMPSPVLFLEFSSVGAADCSQERYPRRAASHTPAQDSPED